MIVNPPAIGRAAAAAAIPQSTGSVDYDSFLKLLVASMRNQDPSKPNDPAEMLSQLASFSSVEQAIKTNNKLDQLLAAGAASQAAALIGKDLALLDGTAAGRISAIEISGGGLTAILDDGQRVRIGDGVRITGP